MTNLEDEDHDWFADDMSDDGHPDEELEQIFAQDFVDELPPANISPEEFAELLHQRVMSETACLTSEALSVTPGFGSQPVPLSIRHEADGCRTVYSDGSEGILSGHPYCPTCQKDIARSVLES